MIERSFPYVVFEIGGIGIRDAVVVTWVLMGALTAASWWVSHHFQDRPGPVQNLLEAIVESMENLIHEIAPQHVDRLIPFVGTLGVFLVLANVIPLVPGVEAPTRDLSTTAALALIVFVATHVYGVWIVGPRAYLRTYLEPSWVLLPFNIIGEAGRTVALAMRLFGNMLSGALIVAILVVAVAPFLVPVPLQLFGLLIGIIQAYVFTLLATVYIAAGLQPHETKSDEETKKEGETT